MQMSSENHQNNLKESTEFVEYHYSDKKSGDNRRGYSNNSTKVNNYPV